MVWRSVIAAAALALVVVAAGAPPLAAQSLAQRLTAPWPDGDSLAVEGQPVTFPTRSPFVPTHVGEGGERDAPTTGIGTLFLPRARPGVRVPAVVTLHGSSGVQWAREMTYGRQLAALGVAVLVVDSFAARRDRATSFIDRLIEITETMMMADAYAGLAYLAARTEIDAARVALVGFSYGAMVATYTAFEQVAALFAPDGRRFAAHVSFYGPCITRFDDVRTTGAPVLMLMGGRDAIIDQDRCAEIAADLRQGGSRVDSVVYPEAVHQWDGGASGPRPIGRVLNGCRFKVERDGTVRDRNTWLPMTGTFLRKLILWNCAGSEPYLIGRDDAVRARSNADLGAFLAAAFAR